VATVFSHALLGITAARAAYPDDRHFSIATWAAILAILPDLDVLGFAFGIRYGDFFGHRGFSHSLVFSFALSMLVVAARFREIALTTARGWGLTVFFFLVTASHGILDAMTDGGLGIAFFSPFENSRYFLPWTPLQVSPIGAGFFSMEGLEVLGNEALWIGLPCATLFAVRHVRNARAKRL